MNVSVIRFNGNVIFVSLHTLRICKVWFNNETRMIEPYLLEINPDDKFYYLVAYDYKKSDLRCFKFYNIKEIRILEQKLRFLKEYRDRIEGIRNNFDPFLSYGHILKVRFTEKGIDRFEKSPHNRPKFIEKNENLQSRLYPLTEFHPRNNESIQIRYLKGCYGAIPFTNDIIFRIKKLNENSKIEK